MTETEKQKAELRGEIRRRFNALSEHWRKERNIYDMQIARAVFMLPEWGEYSALCVYESFRDEVGTTAIIRQAQKEGRDIYVPAEKTGLRRRFEGKEHPETPSKLLIITPGRAFDVSGNRLGRGGGYYDRLFSQLSIQYRAIGLCYSFQLLDNISVSQYDVPVHRVLTETQVL